MLLSLLLLLLFLLLFINSAKQLTCFYMLRTLKVNELMKVSKVSVKWKI